MRPQGQTKLGFFPLPIAEAKRLGNWLSFPERFSALDPCVGDGIAFSALLSHAPARCYGIEIDSSRAQQAHELGIDTLHADTMDVHCPAESVSLLYLNPPYDWECGESNNQRLEYVFLERTYRWLKAAGVLVFVIPQPRLEKCARLLAEQFTDVQVFQLTEPESLQYKQIVVFAIRRKRHTRLADAALIRQTRFLEAISAQSEFAALKESPDLKYAVPVSGPIVLTNAGIPLDEVEDVLLESAAYRQAARILLPKMGHARGRPLTPLHGGAT